MKCLYVAGQDANTREWIPVAELREEQDGYQLRYTRGAYRLPGFAGLGRMQALEKVYYSKALFPFFSNRIISKSRPEYGRYLRWLGLEALPTDPLELLAITGGVGATDSYELVAPPPRVGDTLRFDFFPRGLRYQPPQVVSQIVEVREQSPLYFMRDVQNEKDAKALAIRAERPHPMLLGYVPRYYCAGLSDLLDNSPTQVKARVKRINPDAPLDMKVLVSVEALVTPGFDVLAPMQDFRPINEGQVIEVLAQA